VLRTVYLPLDLDERLKGLASAEGLSKNDLIREAVSVALEKWGSERASAGPAAKAKFRR
jgi:predicted DNA-binding protein